MRQAFAVAATGRPGPVLIDFLKNVTGPEVMIDYEYIHWKENRSCGSLMDLSSSHGLKAPEPDMADIDTLVEMIAQSEKPLLICGGGVVRGRADKQFREFAEKLDAPVAITVMGGGGFPGGHPLTTGMVGMHGSRASNTACNECDLLIAVGCRFSDRVALQPDTFASQAKIVQIDIDRSEIDKNVLTDHHIIGGARQVLELLNRRLPQYDHTAWKEHILPLRAPRQAPEDGHLTPQQVLETIRRLAPQDTIVATDVGQHQMWSIQYFHFDYPGQLLTSGGFGTMGFGLGAAIGAKMGNPDKVVVHTTGDGCFRMNCHELATVQHYGLPIITVVFNNGALGMVRQWQNLIYNKRFSETTLDRGPDFVKLAEAYGLKGFRVTSQAEMEQAFQAALDAGCGCVIDCTLDMDEMVRPMVPGNAHITNFLLK
jgi:acetolactate synthase-1/2/3 large subunit